MKHYEVVAAVVCKDDYQCAPQSETFHLNEHQAYRWCEKEELAELDWAAADVGIVEKLQQ